MNHKPECNEKWEYDKDHCICNWIDKAEQRIIKLLEEQGCDCHNVYCDKMPTAALGSLIALIKEER